MTKTHELKILPRYFHSVCIGTKTFELRKNDRDFRVNDVLTLREWVPDGGTEHGGYYTGEKVVRRVDYVLTGGMPGLEAGYCILAIVPVHQ